MNIFGMGPMELLLIVVLALIVFGPARLPEIMSQVGKAIGDFRRATSDLSEEFNKTIQAELQETRAAVDEAKSAVTEARTAVSDVHASVNSAVTGIPAPVRTAVPPPQDTLPAPNGTGLESHAEDGSATGSNGIAGAAPAMADTVQWSWETSALPEARTAAPETTSPADAPNGSAPPGTPATSADSPTGSTTSPSATSAEHQPPTPPAPLPETHEPAAPAPPVPPKTQERAARDELTPPY